MFSIMYLYDCDITYLFEWTVLLVEIKKSTSKYFALDTSVHRDAWRENLSGQELAVFVSYISLQK